MNFNKIAEVTEFPIKEPDSKVLKSEEIKPVVTNNKKTANIEKGKEGDIPRGGEKFTDVKYSKTGSLNEDFEAKVSNFLKEFIVPSIDSRLEDLEDRLDDPTLSDAEIEDILAEINGEKEALNDTEDQISSIYEDTDMEFTDTKEDLNESKTLVERIYEAKLKEEKVDNHAILDDNGNTVDDLAESLTEAFGDKKVIEYLVEKSGLNYEVYYSEDWRGTFLSKNVKNRGWPNVEDEQYANDVVGFAMDDISNTIQENTGGNLKATLSGRSGGHGIIYNEKNDVLRYYLGYLFNFDVGIPLSTYDEEYGDEAVDLSDFSLDEILTNVTPTSEFLKIDNIWEKTIDDLEKEDFNTPVISEVDESLQPDLTGINA